MDSTGTKDSPRKRLEFDDMDGISSSNVKDCGSLIPLYDAKDLEFVHSNMDEAMIPKIGLEFKNDQDPYDFYNAYAKHVGFGIKKLSGHYFQDASKSIRNQVLACNAEGRRENRKSGSIRLRPESRVGCEARMRVIRNASGNLMVSAVELKHNHRLVSSNKIHMIRSHRKIRPNQALEIEMPSSVGIAPRTAHELMAVQAGGRDVPGFIRLDYRNYLRTKRQKDMQVGDTGEVLEYLQRMQSKDPNFNYAIQVDEFDMMTNIFWTDAKMKADFVNFGDVVCFDTTYEKNNEGRPIALFVGVNHHRQSILFGVALLYDETTKSFEWLFHSFSAAMSGSKPKTILTDQDAAIAKALASTWPETNHRLCIWHICKNMTIHLSNVISRFEGFKKEFKSCVYELEEEDDFLSEWSAMLHKYDLKDNEWLKKTFEVREKWSLVYGRHMFCGDMTNIGRGGSMNALLKQYVSYKNKFLVFFNNFERMIEGRRYKELEAELKANSTVPVMQFPSQLSRHAASVYTPAVHTWFEQEGLKTHDYVCVECEHIGGFRRYKITPFGKNYHHMVTHDAENETFDCSCKKFVFAGILCSHVIKVFLTIGIFRIPDKYFLKRWTRKAKQTDVGINESIVSSSGVDDNTLCQMRYKDICQLNLQLATKCSLMEETYNVARSLIVEALDKVDVIFQTAKKTSGTSLSSNVARVNEERGITVKDVKSKEKPKTGKRRKSGLETSFRRKTCQAKANNTLSSQQPCHDFIPMSSVLGGTSGQTDLQAYHAAYLHHYPPPQVHVNPTYQWPISFHQFSQRDGDVSGTYSFSQSSQMQGSSSSGIVGVECTCVPRCMAGVFCPSS